MRTACGDSSGSCKQQRINFLDRFHKACAKNRLVDELTNLAHDVGDGSRHDFNRIARNLPRVPDSGSEGLRINHENLKNRQKTELGGSVENLLFGGNDSGRPRVLNKKLNGRRTVSETLEEFGV